MSRRVLSPAAPADLEQIRDYTCQRWHDGQAEAYVRVTQHAVELVADNPLIGRSCDEVRTGYRRHTAGSHTPYYRVGAGGELIDVVRIFHKRMDVDLHLD